jgi:hypothetical protein
MASSNDLGSSYHIVPGTSSSNEVSELLSSLNLPKYIGMFIANDIDNISTLNEMDDKHFRMLGVSLGHQLNILKHIRSGSGSFVQCPVGSPPIVNQGRDVNNSEVHSAGVPVLTIFSAPRNSDRESPVPTEYDGDSHPSRVVRAKCYLLFVDSESRADVIDKRVGADETIYANLVPFERAATAQSHRSFAANSSSDSHRSDAIDVVNRPVNLERAEKQAAARPRLQENERSVQKQAAPGCKLAAFRSNFDDSSPSVQQDAVKKSRSVLAHAAPAAVKISVNAHLKAFKAAFTRTLKLIAVELGSLHPVGDCEKVISMFCCCSFNLAWLLSLMCFHSQLELCRKSTLRLASSSPMSALSTIIARARFAICTSLSIVRLSIMASRRCVDSMNCPTM